MIYSQIIENRPVGRFTQDFVDNNSHFEFAPLYEENFIKPKWNGSEYYESATPEEIETYLESITPDVLTPRQLRLALIQSGKSIANIEAFIDSFPEPNRSIVKITWEYSLEFERKNPLMIQMAEMLEISNEQLNQLFTNGKLL